MTESPATSPSRIHLPDPFRRFAIATAILSVTFAWPLAQWATFALGSYLYSHIILIPPVSVWMIWMRRATLPRPDGRGAVAAIVCALAALFFVVYAFAISPESGQGAMHRLIWTIAGYVVGVVAAGFWFLGGKFMRANLVPVGFLVFMIPMPGWAEHAIEIALQRGSAEAADLLFALSGLTYLRDGQLFRLPSITMEIAQECSGIHSSLVLFITSIVAGQMFLPPGWRRWVLTLAVIPLALVRNGFRVLTLGILCERIGPHMIDHWIHHRGGPVFFALSLIPFFILLLALARAGRRPQPGSKNEAGATSPAGGP